MQHKTMHNFKMTVSWILQWYKI